MITIDGSLGEGGGQVIRTAIGMSAVTGKSVKIINIRAKRPNPGLQAQHLTSVRAVAELCQAKVSGLQLGSKEITFEPGKIKFGKFEFDIGTAGSVTLVLQALLPAAIHASAPVEIELFGGTDVSWSPPADYFGHVVCELLKKFGIEINFKILKRGFYPKGGGQVSVFIKPCKELKKIELLEQGAVEKIVVESIASKDLENAKVAERQNEGFKKKISYAEFKKEYVSALSTGSLVCAHAKFKDSLLGTSVLGEKGKSAETVGEECASELLKEINSGACVDKHAADQLLPFIALAGAGALKTSEITQHALTNIQVIEKFLPVNFRIDEKEKKIWI